MKWLTSGKKSKKKKLLMNNTDQNDRIIFVSQNALDRTKKN